MATGNKKQPLSLDDLAEINGGRIKLSGYAILRGLILTAKANDISKERTLQAVREGWENDCEFKRKFTSNPTDDDLQEALDYIDKHW